MRYFIFVFITFLFLVTRISFAQEINRYFLSTDTLLPSKEKEMYIRIENNQFFHNEEFFGNLSNGLTYIGTTLNGRLIYHPYKNVKLEAGAHVIKYSGLDMFSNITPILSFQIEPIKDIKLIMGSLSGGINHQLIEPIYDFNYHLTHQIENGIQILINKKNIFTDIWLDWEQFIFKTDHQQEKITGGISCNYKIPILKQHQLFIIGQALFVHKGGQFHSGDMKLQTIANTVLGFKYQYKPLTFIKAIGLRSEIVTYNNLSNYHMPYNNGHTRYVRLFLNTKWLFFNIGWWNGQNFISSKGNPLFMSISELYTSYHQKYTYLYTAKIALQKELHKSIILEMRFEPYYDMRQSHLDFSYSIYLSFNQNFFLHKKSESKQPF